MMTTVGRVALLVFLLVAVSGVADNAGAQTYPTKPVKMVVPIPPGGPTDLMARYVALRLSEALGQPVVIENRPGAQGIVGSEAVAKSPADGYTLMTGTVGTHAINAALYSKLPYDPVKDFEAVALLASTPNVLLVHPSLNVKSVSDLIALAKSKPGKLNFSSGGNGATNHLAGELFKSMAKVDMVHVPYQGNAAALVDLLAGRVPIGWQIPSTVAQHIKVGKVLALGVTSPKRTPSMPDVPTIAESGLPGYEVALWYGVFAPAGTPKAIVNRLNAEIMKALATPEARERLTGWDAEFTPNTPEQFTTRLKADIAKWAEVVKASGARLD